MRSPDIPEWFANTRRLRRAFEVWSWPAPSEYTGSPNNVYSTGRSATGNLPFTYALEATQTGVQMLRSFRRAARPARTPEPARGDPPTHTATVDRTATASHLHAFNRFEIKYLVPEAQAQELRSELRRRMDDDAHSGPQGYPITSVYYDTPRLTFYWEKIDGLRFRRKLRIRHYGTDDDISQDSGVYVEIKQRVNRVTQKRRVALPYRDALRLCSTDGYEPAGEVPGRDHAFLNEVSTLVGELGLRPTVTTAYQREAWVGREVDLGLRVTLDHRLRGRDRDFHFSPGSLNRLTLPPRLAVLEVKADERVPAWVTDLTARMNLNIVRISKYCQSVQAFGLAPRSTMHAADEVDAILQSAAPLPTPALPSQHVPSDALTTGAEDAADRRNTSTP